MSQYDATFDKKKKMYVTVTYLFIVKFFCLVS